MGSSMWYSPLPNAEMLLFVLFEMLVMSLRRVHLSGTKGYSMSNFMRLLLLMVNGNPVPNAMRLFLVVVDGKSMPNGMECLDMGNTLFKLSVMFLTMNLNSSANNNLMMRFVMNFTMALNMGLNLN